MPLRNFFNCSRRTNLNECPGVCVHAFANMSAAAANPLSVFLQAFFLLCFLHCRQLQQQFIICASISIVKTCLTRVANWIAKRREGKLKLNPQLSNSSRSTCFQDSYYIKFHNIKWKGDFKQQFSPSVYKLQHKRVDKKLPQQIDLVCFIAGFSAQIFSALHFSASQCTGLLLL